MSHEICSNKQYKILSAGDFISFTLFCFKFIVKWIYEEKFCSLKVCDVCEYPMLSDIFGQFASIARIFLS